jgi:hypothetical protein
MTLQRWSIQHDWKRRVAQYDRKQAPAPVLHVMPGGSPVDEVTMLVKTATQAIQRAMAAQPAIQRVGDLRALISTAMDALKLVDQIKARGVSKNTRQEIADEIGRIVVKVDDCRRGDWDRALACVRRSYPAVVLSSSGV